MWWMWTAVALAAEPVPIPEVETGTLVVVVTWQNEDSWAQAAWDRAVRRVQRQRRRAERKSDTPLPPPELPPPVDTPAIGSTVTLYGDALNGGAMIREVDPTGTLSIQMPLGTFDLLVHHDGAVPRQLRGVSLSAGEVLRIDVALEEFADDYMITHRGASRGTSEKTPPGATPSWR